MSLPYTNSKNETRLHAILCVLSHVKKGSRDKDYDPSYSLDDSGQRGANIDGVRYEVKVTGQAYKPKSLLVLQQS